MRIAGWLFLAALTLGVGCTAPDATVRTLFDSGYTDIEVLGRAWFGCGHDDHFATRFRATNPIGRRVEGVVCCGLTKRCTIRF